MTSSVASGSTNRFRDPNAILKINNHVQEKQQPGGDN